MTRPWSPISCLVASFYKIPTEHPESDGTLTWDATGITVVQCHTGDVVGMGYTYGGIDLSPLIHETLAPCVVEHDVMDIPSMWAAMEAAVRNIGNVGVAKMALSAVDLALWDAKAQILNVPLVRLLGATRSAVPLYGSGGFTSYDIETLQSQMGRWAQEGFRYVKMKVGRNPGDDWYRVAAARDAIGPDVELFVDANGAYERKQASALAERFAMSGVRWFEEPVSSDDVAGLHLLRNTCPPGMAIAAGEYGYSLPYFRTLLDAQAVDVLQADATRCGGISEFMRVSGMCQAFCIPLSAHTAPTFHAHVCCALENVVHLEYFHDHVRVEKLLFDGVLAPKDGSLCPDLSRPGLGITLKRSDAARYAR